MFSACGYKWRFIRVPDKRTGSKTTTVCLVKPENMNIGWAKAGVAEFSPNRESVKVIDESETDWAIVNAEKANNPKTDVTKIQVFINYIDYFNKAVGRVIALHKALENMKFNSEFCNTVMDALFQIDNATLPEGPQWKWLSEYSNRVNWD